MELLVSTISDVITLVEALASRGSCNTVMSGLLAVFDLMNIETGSTETDIEAREPAAGLTVLINLLTSIVGDLPFLRAAASSLSNLVESLRANCITFFRGSDSVSSWAAADREHGAHELLNLLTASVIIDEDGFVDSGEVLDSSLDLRSRLAGVDGRRHVGLYHIHFL